MELLIDLSTEKLTQYLRQQKWIPETEAVVSLDKPGEGNMNRVLRATTNSGTLILKQATDFVNKYPDIPAPIERIDVEQRFYRLASQIPELKNKLPGIIGYDPAHHLLAMEDLGSISDYTFLYEKDSVLTENHAIAIADTLVRLHQHQFSTDQVQQFPENLALRKLNHQHIFDFPLMVENGFDLDTITPGLQKVALKYKNDPELKSIATQLGENYLAKGNTLLHGDYYPGSWLASGTGFKLIDPEFGFFGAAEFDLGVLLAHLKLAKQSDSIIQKMLGLYTLPIDEGLLAQFEGIEIIRRLIGLAQLPLELNLSEKEDLLAYAWHKVMSRT